MFSMTSRWVRLGALAFSIQFASPVSAQTTAEEANPTPPGSTPPAGARAEKQETVVVTATKRKEDVTKIPLSVTVVDGKAAEDQHIYTMEDLTRAVPNLSFQGGAAGGGAGLSTVEMRGISSQAGSATVGIYLDDVSMNTRNLYSLGSAEPKFFDIDHIEVLRGPQGTLYGASSMGGTIRFVSNQPNLRSVESYYTADVASTEHGGTSGVVSGVYNALLSPGVAALRLGAQLGKVGGYIDQVSQSDPTQVIAKNINSQNNVVARAALKWVPDGRWDVTPAVFYQRVKSDGLDVSHLTDINGNPLPENRTDQLLREPGTDTLVVPSLTVGYNFGKTDLTSVTSYFSRTFNRQQDGQAANSEFFACCLITPPDLAAAVGNLPSAVLLDNSIRQFSQELRLASKPYEGHGWPLIWLAGLYYQHLKTKVTDNEPVYGINSTFAQFGASPADPNVLSGAYPNPFPDDNVYFSERRYKERQSSVFGEFTYYLSQTLRLTLGARYLKATSSLDRDGNFYFANGPQYSSFSGDYHKLTPKYALTWDVTPASSVFATAAEGFRLGGANREIPLSICGEELFNVYHLTQSPGTFNSDSLWSYEIGSKGRYFANRLYLSAAAFWVKWKDIQQDIQLNCTFDFEGNFGKATSKGVEVEGNVRPIENLTIGFFGGVTHATFDEDVPSINVTAGAQLLGIPRWNGAINGEYRFYNTAAASAFLRGAIRWTGTSRGSFNPDNPDYHRDAYHIVDASIGADAGRWEVSLYAKNLLNDQTVIQRPFVQFLTEALRPRPRTVGILVSLRL